MDPSFEQRNTIEQRANLFQEKYKKILSTSVTPENIQIFFESTLNDLIALVGDVVSQYRVSNPESPLKQAELEDEALRSMGIPDGQETLEAISARARMIIRLKHLIQSQTHIADAVFIPPKPESRGVEIGSGAGMDQKELIPRLLTLLYILENDLAQDFSEEGIDSPMIQITQGITTDHMMRRHPYFRVLIESLNRAVYICEEEGNASYIFDTKTLRFPIEEIDKLDKESLNNLIGARPEIGRRLIQSPAWREKMIGYLTEDFSGDMKNIDASQKKKSDFTAVVDMPRKKEGWESANGLRAIAHVGNPEKIRIFVEQFRAEHSEWFELQRTGKSSMAEHYHPDLVARIKEHFLATPRKKEGWENASVLQNIFHVRLSTIEKFAEQFRAEYPEWFELQRKGRSTIAEHYHPDLVARIKEHFNIPEKKEGWESARSFVRNEKISSEGTIIAYVEQFREEHPEWFELQKPGGGRAAEYYHPELVLRIRKHFTDIPQKKEGWENENSLNFESTIRRPTNETIRKYALQFHASHPEWFEVQKSRWTPTTQYHPDLVAIIRAHFSGALEKKAGWESVSGLCNITGTDHKTIQNYVKQFRSEHPEWFEMQKIKGRDFECFHPDLVFKIMEHYNILEKKDGWESASSLRGIVADYSLIKIFAEQFRDEHPEWFEIQKMWAKTVEHYHPNLVKKIKEHFPVIPQKKEGWESARSLQSVVRSESSTITKFVSRFHESHPEWFEVQRNNTRTSEHYHPDLVAKIKEHFPPR